MDTAKSKILFAEDEEAIAKGIVYNLEKEGYVVTHVADGDSALKELENGTYDLAILDVMLPKQNGFWVLEQARKKNILTPVLMLTALSDTKSRVHGIKSGADDYLGKPFDIEELLARSEALLRRRQWHKEDEPGFKTSLGTLIFDRGAHQLRRADNANRTASLTAMESKLLAMLVDQAQGPDSTRVIPRSELLAKVWGLNEGTQTRTLDMFVARLRQMFSSLGEDSVKIEAMRGVGYRLVL